MSNIGYRWYSVLLELTDNLVVKFSLHMHENIRKDYYLGKIRRTRPGEKCV
jgi:hypothetical protein